MAMHEECLGVVVSYVKDILARVTTPGNGHEFGLSVDEIMSELNQIGFRSVGPGPVQDLREQVLKVLTTPVAGRNLFEAFLRPDRMVLYKNSPDGYNPIYYDLTPIYPHDQPVPQEFDQPVPNTVEELQQEIWRLQTLHQEAIRKQKHLILCNQMLQNAVQLPDETKKLETTVLAMRDLQSLVDGRIRALLCFIGVGDEGGGK
jgi:hypothetical protein